MFNSADASESSSDEDHDTRSTMPYRNTADAQPARRATGMATSAAAPTSSGGGDKVLYLVVCLPQYSLPPFNHTLLSCSRISGYGGDPD